MDAAWSLMHSSLDTLRERVSSSDFKQRSGVELQTSPGRHRAACAWPSPRHSGHLLGG